MTAADYPLGLSVAESRVLDAFPVQDLCYVGRRVSVDFAFCP